MNRTRRRWHMPLMLALAALALALALPACSKERCYNGSPEVCKCLCGGQEVKFNYCPALDYTHYECADFNGEACQIDGYMQCVTDGNLDECCI